MANYINSTLEDVKFHIDTEDFDGPIDLLVKFVKESKIDIMSIFISDITTQYVNYVHTLKQLNYEYISEYIIFAALLLEIKSEKMNPQPVFDDDSYDDNQDDYYSDAEMAIIEEVRKKLLDECPEQLKPREIINVFYPEPQYTESDYKLVAKDLTLEKLLDAYKLVLEKDEIEDLTPKVQSIAKDRFTVSDKVRDITQIIREKQKVSFFALFQKDYTKTEFLTIFLAVLELVKKQVAFAKQDDFGKDIILEHNTEDDSNIKEGDLLSDVDEYN